MDSIFSFNHYSKRLFSENLQLGLKLSYKIKKDPFNTFEKILSLKKQFNVNTLFFFSVGDYTTYDTNVSSSKNRYRLLIKEIQISTRALQHHIEDIEDYLKK